MKDRVRPRAIWIALLLAVSLGCGPAPSPDHILVGGRIWTGDSLQAEVTAIAIRGERIVARGDDATIRALADPQTRVTELGGRRVVPGLHDAHWHLPTRRNADLTGAGNVEEIVRRLRSFAATLPPEAWITGRGWTPEMFPRRTAHRRHLDGAFPDRAVLLTDRDGHQVLANSRALALGGVGRETREPAGGAIIRDEGGQPTGLLQETASALVRRHLPTPSAEEVYAALKYEMRRAVERGLTALQVANALDSAETAAFERALAEDSLLVRFRVGVPFAKDASDDALARYRALSESHRGSMLRYGIAKGMLDGTVDAGTAAMLAPYSQGEGSGLPRWEQAELNAAVERYSRAGLQVELHAIGDRAIRMALDAYEATATARGPAAERRGAPDARRHRVEHLEVPDPADIPRFATLGVIASTQAIFALPDATTIENYAPMLGPERSARAMPFKALDDAGAIQAFGSDYPVFPMDPLLGIYVAITRQTPEGTPAGGWFPEQRISIERALRHYTWGSAFAAFREQELGTLATGMLADLVVLSEEIIGVGPAALLRAKPVLTMVGGREVFTIPF